MSLSVHQIPPKPLPLESRNSHIVHVLPRQRWNSFQNQFTVHFINFIKNNSANRRWLEAQIFTAICLFTVIRPTLFVSVSWIIWCCHLADQLVFCYFLYLSVLTYSYGELNCDGLHILINLIYIITPLLTFTHKPVLAWDPSSISQ